MELYLCSPYMPSIWWRGKRFFYPQHLILTDGEVAFFALAFLTIWTVRSSNAAPDVVFVCFPKRPYLLWGPSGFHFNRCQGSFPELKVPWGVKLTNDVQNCGE